MSEDILKADQAGQSASATAPSHHTKPKRGHRISIMAAVLTVLLAIVLIILGERAIFDLNRSFNPAVIEQAGAAKTGMAYPGDMMVSDSYDGVYGNYAVETSGLSDSVVYYPFEQESEYRLYRMLIHSAFVIPAFLLVFVLYFWIWHKATDNPFKVVVFGYLVFAFWMMLHLLGEIAGFVLEEYQNIGIYLILLFLAAVFTWLMILLQRRINRKQHA